MRKLEYAIGEQFIVDHIIYIVVESDTISCYGCAFNIEEENECLDRNAKCGECSGKYRKDGKYVIFKKIGEAG